jgi:biopolymer transport protein ExbB
MDEPASVNPEILRFALNDGIDRRCRTIFMHSHWDVAITRLPGRTLRTDVPDDPLTKDAIAMKWQSTLRMVLVAVALLALLDVGAGTLFAQATPAAPAVDAVPTASTLSILTRLILEELDFVTVTIFILSIVSVTFIVRGFLQARQAVVAPPATVERIREMITNRQYQELLAFTETDPSFISKSINPALRRAPNYSAMKDAMEIAVGEETADAFRRIEILNVIGNLGPLLGLLGTVLGMIESFDAMNRAGGSANPALLAGGIATALAHTFLGLFLAIPTLAAFGILRTMVDRLTARAALVAEELLNLMKPGSETKPTVTPPRPATVTR